MRVCHKKMKWKMNMGKCKAREGIEEEFAENNRMPVLGFRKGQMGEEHGSWP